MFKNYLINLDTGRERREHMDAAFGSLRLAYERIAAVDGSSPEVQALAAASPGMTHGEVGNFLSHQRVWNLIASKDDPYAAVFEDDIFLAPALAGFLHDWQWIPADADIVKIETMLMSVNVDKAATAIRDGFSLPRLRSTHWGVAGYIISAEAARALSKLALKPTRPADQVLFDFDEKRPGAFVVYQLDPALCIQHDVMAGPKQRASPLGSIIQNKRNLIALPVKQKTPLTRATNELRRLEALIARIFRGRVVRKKIPYAGGT